MSEFVTPAIFCVPADVCFQQTETSAIKDEQEPRLQKLSWFYHIEQPIIAHIIEHLITS